MTDAAREELLDRWEDAAKGWGRQAERWAEAVAPVTEVMLALAALAPGQRVLELAAGPGDLSRRAALIVAPTKVLCTDGVEAMLDVARELAAEDGVTNLEFQRAQLEWIDLPAAAVDVILCRYGLMLAMDPEAALRECRRVLSPGGRLVVAVQAAAELNPWMTVPARAAGDLGRLGPPPPGGPGPFALAPDGLLADLLGSAGFFDVSVSAVDFHWRYRDARDWIGEKIDHSPGFSGMWAQCDDDTRTALRGRLDELAAGYRQPDGSLRVPGRALVASAEA